MNRAENRIAYLQKAPLDQVILEDLWEHIAEEQSLHVELLGKNPEEFYLGVSARLKENLIGQDHAIEKVIDVLNLMAKQPPRRAPRGRFLFAGPPGVGKTHLGRQLAIQLGLGEEAFFVFNMSEYASQGARTRFMGADPGYVGYKSSRTIYDLVRARPSCVILLDEIDRADASIQDILLSILEGEGNDAEGNPVYFSQVIFIMTTNQGQDQVEEAYRQLRHKGASRHELAEQFSDEKLRNLILKGVLDETEARMKADLDQRLADIKETYLEQQDASFIEDYITLKQEAAQLERVQKKTPLDRALLDRVDFVIPFFPIQEPDYLQKILTLCLQRYGWQDCPESIRNTIVSEALENQQSARSIERLVMKHKLAVSA
jgi:ATP-dependent Clp protease ATP-binding subunit ClpA